MYARPYFPNDTELADLSARLNLLPHSYPEVGQSQQDFPLGYDHDRNQVYLGVGDATFEKAKMALSEWQMFPSTWTKVYPAKAPIQKGQLVLVLFQLFGFWWANPCRIIYTVDEPKRFGFGYGTVQGHVEKGEEYFGVYQDAAGKVWYEVKAYSKPGIWLTRLTYPLARRFQRRFVQGSKAGMVAAVGSPHQSAPTSIPS